MKEYLDISKCCVSLLCIKNDSKMKIYTTVEVNEIETEVSVTFGKVEGNEIEVSNIIDVHTGEDVEADNAEMLYDECREAMAERSAA